MPTDDLPPPAPGSSGLGPSSERPAPEPWTAEIHPVVESAAPGAGAAGYGLLDFHEVPAELGVFDTEPDWTGGSYRVYAAWSEADCIRYGQGERYDFCISRRHHNYYHDYRARYRSTYYFVYDAARSPFDKTHVTVVAARPDGSYGFTYANNAEDYDTRRLRNDLDHFLTTKPGLEQAKALFTCQPPTPVETADVEAARAAGAGKGAFEVLTLTQQLMFVRLGTPLTGAEYAQAPDEVREAYISRAHLLTDPQAHCSTEAQRRRSAQLFRLFNEADRLHTADWLQRYPLPSPAIVAAHHAPRWPSRAAESAAWRCPATAPPLLSAMEEGKAAVGPLVSGPDGSLCLTMLQRAVAANPPALFPVQELAAHPPGAAGGAVIIARQGSGFAVLSGNVHVAQANLAGEVDLVVRLATRANLAYARIEVAG